MGQNQSREQGTHRQSSLKEAQPRWPHSQNVFGINRQQSGRAAQQDGEQIQGDGGQDGAAGENKLKADDQIGKRHPLFNGHDMVAAHQADQQQADQGGGSIDGINGGGVMSERNQGATGCRTRDGGEMEAAAIPGDRLRKILAGHQVRQKGRASGPKKSAGGAGG